MRLLTMVLLVAVLSGCGSDPSDLGRAAGEPGERLLGRWIPLEPNDGDGDPFVEFEARQLNGYDGCNAFGSNWRLDDDQLLVGSIEATQQGCHPDAVSDLPEVLASDPRVTFADDHLVLVTGSHAFELRRQ